ncbi:RpiR family transcriptional regulator [Staphylococcus aureus]|uniref:RpiR family transcriptional regulator n=1 Tax=Staphylococcus aureus TaxID=1280 RepID=A0A380DJ87_STAAU|nr:RpiR family transcriptional regulator [Staphylococcus aureus]
MMTNILYRIDKQLSDFTKTEKIIADYILKNPHKIIDMTVNDLADVRMLVQHQLLDLVGK